MIILDTNVISESLRRRPDSSVLRWIDEQPAGSLYLCTPVLAELRYGVDRLDDGPRKDLLHAAVDRIENDFYHGRILPLDTATAREYGRLAAELRRKGRPVGQMDTLITAIAYSQRAVVATRNTAHFADFGLELINPFEAVAHR